MIFQIQEPNHELTEGYLITSIKTSVVFFIGWMIGIMIIYTYPCMSWSSDRFPSTLLFLDKYHIFSWIFSGVTLFFHFKRILKKSANRLITNFNFMDEKSELKLEMLNYYSGKTSNETIEFAKLKIVSEIVSDKFYGKQRVFHILNNCKPITTLNIDRSDWRKFPEIEKLIQKLEEFI